MRILNIAHGEFLMVGAYLTWMAQTSFGLSPLLMVPVSFALLMALGLAVHWLCFRRLTAHLAQPRHLRGARPDGRLRPDVPGAELRLLVWGGDLRGYDFLTDPVTIGGAQFAGQQAAGVRAGAGCSAAR